MRHTRTYHELTPERQMEAMSYIAEAVGAANRTKWKIAHSFYLSALDITFYVGGSAAARMSVEALIGDSDVCRHLNLLDRARMLDEQAVDIAGRFRPWWPPKAAARASQLTTLELDGQPELALRGFLSLARELVSCGRTAELPLLHAYEHVLSSAKRAGQFDAAFAAASAGAALAESLAADYPGFASSFFQWLGFLESAMIGCGGDADRAVEMLATSKQLRLSSPRRDATLRLVDGEIALLCGDRDRGCELINSAVARLRDAEMVRHCASVQRMIRQRDLALG